MDKQESMIDGLGKAAQKSQGGTFRDQGTSSVKGSGTMNCGDAASVSSPHTSHDNAMHQQGGKGRATKPLGG